MEELQEARINDGAGGCLTDFETYFLKSITLKSLLQGVTVSLINTNFLQLTFLMRTHN